jgi:hypothetical protein
MKEQHEQGMNLEGESWERDTCLGQKHSTDSFPIG